MSQKMKAKKKGNGSSRNYLKTTNDYEQAQALVEAGKFEQALEILEPLAARRKRDGELQYLLGFAYVNTGDKWKALIHYRKALELLHEPELWLPLGLIYLDLGLRALGLHALHHSKQAGNHLEIPAPVFQVMALIEDDIRDMANRFSLAISTVEQGLRLMDEGRIALYLNDYSQSIYFNRKAIKFLGEFPPPRNNLSLGLFYTGQSAEAIQVARQVLAGYPKDIQARANLVRFLAWTGQEAEALSHYELLKQQSPSELDNLYKIAETAAIMEDDGLVYKLLENSSVPGLKDRDLTADMQLKLAIAEANLGKTDRAKRRLRLLIPDNERAEKILEAIKAGKKGMGWLPRFSYVHFSDLIPRKEFHIFTNLFKRESDTNSSRLKREIQRFASRFPQIVLMGKKLIIEEQQFEAGIMFLAKIGTPAANAALREFGFSQIGSDEARMKAIFTLLNEEQLQSGEMVRIWRDGQWREVRLQSYQIREGASSEYSPQVVDLLNEGLEAFQDNHLKEAEQLFLGVLKLEPRAKEGYNNLGTIYARQGKPDQAKEMFQKALQIDPQYTLPRCNLAIFLLEDEDIEGAEKMIAPLDGQEVFDPHSITFLSYIQARIAVEKKEYDAAISILDMALQIDPDFEQAKDLIANLKLRQQMMSGIGIWQERARQRQQAVRSKQRQNLTTNQPTLGEALSVFSKEILTGMARVILPWGGWSALKKAGLLELLAVNLQDPLVLKQVYSQMTDIEQKAIQQILNTGGYIAWQEFDTKYGNDLEESPYWQYHEPESLLGRLRVRALLAEAVVDGNLILAIPVELRKLLKSHV